MKHAHTMKILYICLNFEGLHFPPTKIMIVNSVDIFFLQFTHEWWLQLHWSIGMHFGRPIHELPNSIQYYCISNTQIII